MSHFTRNQMSQYPELYRSRQWVPYKCELDSSTYHTRHESPDGYPSLEHQHNHSDMLQAWLKQTLSSSTSLDPETHSTSLASLGDEDGTTEAPKPTRSKKAARKALHCAVLVHQTTAKLTRKAREKYESRKQRKAQEELERYQRWVANGCPQKRSRFEDETAYNPSPQEWKRVQYDSDEGYSIFLNRSDHNFYKQHEGGNFHKIRPRDYDIDPEDYTIYMQ